MDSPAANATPCPLPHPFAEASPGEVLALLDSVPDGFVTLDTAWRITYLNAYALQYTERLKRGKAELLGRALWDAFPELADTPVEAEFRRSAASGSTRNFEFLFPPLASWFEVRTCPAAAGLIVYFRDITERKHAEDSLRQSEEQLRALANSIPQLAWVADNTGHVIWSNQRWQEFTGLGYDVASTITWENLHDPATLDEARRQWRESLETGQAFEMEMRMRPHGAPYRWFLTRVLPLRDRYGHAVRWFGTATDVDLVKRAQEALREETKVLELLNSTGLALAAQRDLHALLHTVTEAATALSGARWGAFFYHEPDKPGEGLGLTTLAGPDSAAFARWCEPLGLSATLLRADDIGANAFGPATPGPDRVRSVLSVPVRTRSGQTFGNLVFGHPEPGQFSERSERMVAGIAAQAAIAIDNARLVETTQQAADERRILLEREREARAEAERTSRMKDEFLATLSHELRTPLSAILGWAQLLRRGQRGVADTARGLETIERNARVQAQLVDDLLDMSRINSGKVMLSVQLLQLSNVIDAAIETVRAAADAKRIRIERHVLPDAGLVAGDPGRLQQVLWNLLTNAIKFTPQEGLVRVDMRAVPGHLEVTVADSGKGIAPEFLPHVFERFRQADATMARQHGGLGLGLAIVKNLIEQHGGTVRAESEGEHCGSSFSFSLPLAHGLPRPGRLPERPAPPLLAAVEPATHTLAGVQVLVVDDEVDARDLVAHLLSDCGAHVRCAASAAEALLLIKRASPDVIVCDLGMPVVDGFGLMAQVRHLRPPGAAPLPMLALTAFARAEDRDRALAAGFASHVAKPVEPAALIAALAEICPEIESRPT